MLQKIIIGSANFKNPYGMYSQKKTLNKNNVLKIINIANKFGIKEIDTSCNYGKSEQIISELIDTKKIHKWNINTKIDLRYLKLNNLYENTDLKKITKKFSKKINIILAHNTDDLFKDKKYLKFFNLFKKNKIKIGFSAYEVKEASRVLKIFKPDVIQIPINILNKEFLNYDFLKKVKKNKIKLHARSIFLQGLLFQKPSTIIDKSKDLEKILIELTKIANSIKLNLAELSLVYVNSLSFINKLILGFENKSHIIHLSKILKKNPRLDSKTINEINNLSYSNKKVLDPRKW